MTALPVPTTASVTPVKDPLDDMRRVGGEKAIEVLGFGEPDHELLAIAGQVITDPEAAYAALHALLRRRLGRTPSTRASWAVIVERTRDAAERFAAADVVDWTPGRTLMRQLAEEHGTTEGQLRNWHSVYRWLPGWAVALARKGSLTYAGALEINRLRSCGHDFPMGAVLERLRSTVPDIPLEYGVIPARALRRAVAQAVTYVGMNGG